MKATISALLFLTGAAAAAELPPAGYFHGRYEAVGRMPGNAGAPFAGSLTVAGEGDRLLLDSDVLGAGWLERVQGAREATSPLRGEIGGYLIFCLYQSDLDNYPRLTCKFGSKDRSGEPGLLTLWPSH